jgi:hypothetical protein
VYRPLGERPAPRADAKAGYDRAEVEACKVFSGKPPVERVV